MVVTRLAAAIGVLGLAQVGQSHVDALTLTLRLRGAGGGEGNGRSDSEVMRGDVRDHHRDRQPQRRGRELRGQSKLESLI